MITDSGAGVVTVCVPQAVSASIASISATMAITFGCSFMTKECDLMVYEVETIYGFDLLVNRKSRFLHHT